MQEVFLPSLSILLVCGSCVTDFRKFTKRIERLLSSIKYICSKEEEWKAIIAQSPSLSSCRYISRDEAFEDLEIARAQLDLSCVNSLTRFAEVPLAKLGMLMSAALTNTRARLATDPRDMVHGVLGILCPSEREGTQSTTHFSLPWCFNKQ